MATGFGEAEDIPGVKEGGTGQDRDMYGMEADGRREPTDTGGTGAIGKKLRIKGLGDFGILFNQYHQQLLYPLYECCIVNATITKY